MRKYCNHVESLTHIGLIWLLDKWGKLTWTSQLCYVSCFDLSLY